RIVRGCGRRARTSGRPADRFAVLGLADRAAAWTACPAGVEVPAAAARAGADTRHPATIAATPAALRALALGLLATLVVRELASLRVLFVVAWRDGPRWNRSTGRERAWRQRSALRRAEALSAAASATSAASAARELVGAGRPGPGHHRSLVRPGVCSTRVKRTGIGRAAVGRTGVGRARIGRSAVARARFLWALLELFHGHAPLRRMRSQRVPSLVSFTRIPYVRSSSARSSSERL